MFLHTIKPYKDYQIYFHHSREEFMFISKLDNLEDYCVYAFSMPGIQRKIDVEICKIKGIEPPLNYHDVDEFYKDS